VAGRLAGKRVVVSGGASGIGLACAKYVVAEGGSVMIGDVNERDGEVAAEALGPAGRFVRCDVRSERDVEALVAETVKTFGRVDGLVNCAGMLVYGPLTEISADRWDESFAVNARSVFFACRAAIPELRAAGGGAIVNMSSMAGLRGGSGLTLYSATKAAMIGLTVSLALELAPDRIRVNAVCPGWIDTAFNKPVIDGIGGAEATAQVVRQTTPLGRMGTAEEVAALVAYLVSEESAFVTAQALSINGGSYNG
jgi:NAD(P)-dependent dehydrogenase (short-subunit alcohol dehydrogenase family)